MNTTGQTLANSEWLKGKNSLWLVIVNRKVHSAHKDKETAHAWAMCKEYDGEDISLIELGDEAARQIADIYIDESR